MLSKIKFLLMPPVFPDAEKTRVASILYAVLVATLIILVAATIASVILNHVNQQIWFVSWPAIVGSLLLLGLTWLVRDGKVQAAGIGLVATMFLIIVGAGLDSGGVDNVSLGALVIVIIVAALVLGARVALVTAAASIVTTIAIAYAQSSGSLVLPPSTTMPTTVYTAVFIIAGFLMFQAARNFSDTLVQVREANARLTEFSTGLEERVGDRTRELQLAAEVGRRVSRIRALDQLLPEAAELIHSRFDLYYTQIYLTDTTGQTLVLRAGTGIVGQQLVQAGHRLAIDSTSINGTAASRKQAVLVEDTEKSPTFRPNALLPATRSELAVPLIAGDTVVGVLNLQSSQAGTFSQETLPAFEALSGQLATAIENASLINELTQARSEIENQARRLTREGWREFLDGIQHSQLVGYSYDGHSKRVETLAEPAVEAAASHMATPISLAGAELGQIQLKLKADGPGRKQPDQSVLEAVARQVAQQVENLRLLNETARYRTEAEEALRRLTRESWANYENVTPGVVYEYDRQQIRQRPEGDEGDSNGRSGLVGQPQLAQPQLAQPQLAQPLLVRGEPIGLLELDLPDEQDEEAAELVTAVAQQLSSHLENLRLSQTSETALSEAQQRSQELAQINQIVTTVAGSLNLQQSLQIVADGLASILDVDQVAIALLDEAGENLQIVADHYDRERSQSAIGISLPLAGNDLSQEILETRQSAAIEDAQNHPRTALIHEALRSRGVETLYIFPIVTANKAIGTVGIDVLEKGHTLSSNQLRLAETVIFQAATAIQNSQLFDQLEGLLASAEKQARRLAILNDLGDRFNRSQTAEEVYQLVLEHAGQLFEYDRISLLQFDSEARQATVLAVEDNLTQELQAGIVVPLSAAITEKVINQRAVLRILDDEKADDDVVASSLIAPLLTGRGVLGTINVSSKTPHAYSSQDENNLLQLANYIASTLENQRLFTTVEARAQELEVLNEVARSVSYQLEPQQLMETVFNQVRRILPADIFFVAVYDAESDMVSYPYIYDDGELSAAEMSPLNPATRVHAVISSGEPVLNHLTAEEIEDIKQNQTAVLLGDDTGKIPASLLYVPLKSGNQIKGVLSIQAYASNMYSEADVTLLTGVASYAAVALENARLFEQTQSALGETATLYDISARLNAATNPDDILATIAEVSQADNLALMTFRLDQDNNPETMEVVATWPEAAPDPDFVLPEIKVVDYPTSALWLNSPQSPIFISDRDTDEQLDEGSRAMLAQIGIQSSVWMPLYQNRRWIGLLTLNWPTTRQFPERMRRIFQSLMDQTTIAVSQWQLLQQTQARAAQLEELTDLENDLSQSSNAAELLTVALEVAQSPTRAALHYIDVDQQGQPLTTRLAAEWRGGGEIETAVSVHAQPVNSLPQIDTWSQTPNQVYIDSHGGQFLVVLPLHSAGRWQGAILLEWDPVHVMSDHETFLLRQLLEPISAVFASQRALAETEALYQASAKLNTAQDYDQILDVLREYTIAGQQPNLVSLNMFNRPWTVQQQPESIYTLTHWSAQPLSAEVLTHSLADYPSAATLLKPDQATIISDARTDSRLDDNVRSLIVRIYKATSVLLIPLVSGGRWRGYISAFYAEEKIISETEIRRLTSLASQAAVALQSLQLLRQTEQQLANLTNIQQTTASLSGALSFEEATKTFLQQVCLAVDADSVDIYELHGNAVNRLAAYPAHPEKPVAFSCTLDEQTMMRWAVETRRPATLAINDQTLDSKLRQSFAKAGIKSNVTLPLIGRRGIYGILSVNREKDLRQFDEQELNLLQTLSNQAMIAFERVQLLEETTRRAEQEQRLREVTTRVRGSIDVDTIMRTAVQEVGRVLGRRTMIYLDHESENGREPIGLSDDQLAYEMEQS